MKELHSKQLHARLRVPLESRRYVDDLFNRTARHYDTVEKLFLNGGLLGQFVGLFRHTGCFAGNRWFIGGLPRDHHRENQENQQE